MSASVATRSLATVREVARPEATSPDLDYWLAHCEGYVVRSSGGRLGIVEKVRLAEDVDRAESLTVLAGMFGRRRLIIDATEIEAIVPHERRVVLRPGATIGGTEPCR
jgi:hypothetical protein